MNNANSPIRAAGQSTWMALALSATALSPAWGASHQAGHAGHRDHGQQVAQAVASDLTDAEVRKVDKDGGKLTLRHADIKSLDMPAMTMVFVVKDKALLDNLQAGDKIRFKAINDAGRYTVTEIQPAK